MGYRRDKTPLTAAEAKELFSYDPLTGELCWAKPKGRVKPGTPCRSPHARGYYQVEVRGRNYLVHRLIWAIVTGEWSENDIDHVDGDRVNNRWLNLRNVTRQTNLENQRKPRSDNTTGFLGVTPTKGRFRANIQVNKKQIILGHFDTPEEAHEVYLKAKRELHEGNTL